MPGLIGCHLHQVLGWTNKRFGIGIGCCQLDGDYTICNGDVNFCEKPKTLIQHMVQKIEKMTFAPDKDSR